MKSITLGLCATALLGLLIASAAITPAAALSAELAIKCRQMAVKAYPPMRPGTKKGTADAERKFYRDCIANNGVMPESNSPNAAAPPSK